jgi:predicted PurR-regulated permease PerM
MDELSAGRLSSLQRIKDKAKSDKEDKESEATPSPVSSSGASGPLIIIAVVTCCAVLWAAQAIIVPTVMAVVLALILTPVVAMLEKWRIPTGAAAIMVVVFAVTMIAGTAIALAPGVTDWMKRAPEISRTIERKLQPVKEWLVSFQAASSQLDKITTVGATPGTATIVAAPSGGASIVETAPAAIAQTLYVIVLALFLIGSRKTYRKRFVLLSSDRANRLRVLRIMNESLEQVSGYLFTMMCVSIGLAIVTTACFAIAGIEYPFLWGAAFGAASIIPYIGPTAVILLCALVQFATQDTLGAAAVAPLILLGVNTIESNFVTPFLVSRRIAVSAIAIFLALAVFIWLWGPMASILAVPLLILFHAIAKHVPSLQPYAILLQSENDHSEEVTSSARQRFSEVPDTTAATWRDTIASFVRPWRKSETVPRPAETANEASSVRPAVAVCATI